MKTKTQKKILLLLIMVAVAIMTIAPTFTTAYAVGTGYTNNNVLYEVASSTNCPYCVNADKSINKFKLDPAHDNAVFIKYQADWPSNEDGHSCPYTNKYSNNRIEYYRTNWKPKYNTVERPNLPEGMDKQYINPFSSIPSVSVNGEIQTAVFGATDGNSIMNAKYAEFENQTTQVDISALNIKYLGGVEYRVSITLTSLIDLVGDKTTLMLVLTESNIKHVWSASSSLTEVNDVARKIYPDVDGMGVELKAGTSKDYVFDITTDESYNEDNLKLVAFVQDENATDLTTKKIMQTAVTNKGAFKTISIFGSIVELLGLIAEVSVWAFVIKVIVGTLAISLICVLYKKQNGTPTPAAPSLRAYTFAADPPTLKTTDTVIKDQITITDAMMNKTKLERERLNNELNKPFSQIMDERKNKK